MIPFLLAAVGGYLIGDSMKSHETMANGGGVSKKLSKSEKIEELSGNKWKSHSQGFRNNKKINAVLKGIIDMWSDIDSFASGGNNYHIAILLNDGNVVTFHNDNNDITWSKKKYKTLRGYYNSGNWGSNSYQYDVDANTATTNEIIEAIKKHNIIDVMEDGGEIAESNNRMLMSSVKEIKHHAEELEKIVEPDTQVDAWVVAKSERSATDLSDITHYLEGEK